MATLTLNPDFEQDGPRLVLLLVGGTKKRQQRDIDLAKAYWQDYKQRKSTG
jgi:putative component of toxin-antitoxin plasmid stabilization module